MAPSVECVDTTVVAPTAASSREGKGQIQRVPDFLGRVPIPLRLSFKAGVDRAVERHCLQTGQRLWAQAITGGEWFTPFAAVMVGDLAEQLPGMLVVTCSAELLGSPVQRFYRGSAAGSLPAYDPRVIAAGLPDPLGIFQLFALIPFVMLINEKRLGELGLATPQGWADLLKPCYQRQIVFGGWRPEGASHYEECNRFLLLCLLEQFAEAGIRAFANNVRALWHHVQIARDFAHPAYPDGPAIAILPLAQANLCPRRESTRIVWPQEGAYTMPLAFMLQPQRQAALAPLVDYLCAEELMSLLWQNDYPPAFVSTSGSLPEEARFNWLGWERVRQQDMGARAEQAFALFFSCWQGGV